MDFRYSFKDLYEASLEDDVLLEGLQYTHSADVTLKHIVREFGDLICGNLSLKILELRNQDGFIDNTISIIHKNKDEVKNNEKLIERMRFFGYHYVNDKVITKSMLSNFGLKTDRDYLFSSSFEGTYPTEVRRDSLPDILFHITKKSNLEKILKIGLLPKKTTTSFNHPANRIYLFATFQPERDIPLLKRSLSKDTRTPESEYVVLKVSDYYPNHERFFLDPSMLEGDISDTCGGVFVHRGINPSFISVYQLS